MDKTVRGIMEEEIRKGMNPSEDGIWRICPSVVADKIILQLKALLKSNMPEKKSRYEVTESRYGHKQLLPFTREELEHNKLIDQINQVIDEVMG